MNHEDKVIKQICDHPFSGPLTKVITRHCRKLRDIANSPLTHPSSAYALDGASGQLYEDFGEAIREIIKNMPPPSDNVVVGFTRKAA